MRPLVHQIWHGDSSGELGQKIAATRQIQSIITDPPFGINNRSKMAVTPEGKEHARTIEGDETPEQAWAIFTAVMNTLLPGMKDESDIYIFTSPAVLELWLHWTKLYFKPWEFKYKGIGVWAKGSPGTGDVDSWGQAMEIIIYFKRGKRKLMVTGAPRLNFVFNDPQIAPQKLIHPHEKPASLLHKLIQHSTVKGELVVDPFGGSGSLVRAAQQIGRSAIAIEKDPLNYQKALRALEGNMGGGFEF